MSGVRDIVLIVGLALFPLRSIQHFIWPLSWCLLADYCNHTWIPECGYDELMDAYRLFTDECDMFEYNCDHETDYEPKNYADCFKQQMCPVVKQPCPSRPTCPDHRYHRMGDRYVFITPAAHARRNARRNGLRMGTLKDTLPPRMLKGKRRYTLKRTRPTVSTKKQLLIRKMRNRTPTRQGPTRTRTRTNPTRTTASKQKPLRTKKSHPRTKKPLPSAEKTHPTTKEALPIPSSAKKEQTTVKTITTLIPISTTDHEVTNYSLCFGQVICPKPKACPSRPTCPDHRYHRMGDRYVFLNPRRQGRRMNNLGRSTLPMKMLSGKRRYTPEKLKKRNRTHYILRTRRTTPLRTRPRGPPTRHTWPKKTNADKTTKSKTTKKENIKTTKTSKIKGTVSGIQTVILKRETIKRNGKTLVKIVSRLVNKIAKPLNDIEDNKIGDEDFIE